MSKHRRPRRARGQPQPEAPPPPCPRPVYQCEATACPASQGMTFALGTHQARTPRLAMRWLRARARDVIDQLDPPTADPARHWLTDEHHHEHALSHLADGRAYVHTIHDEDVHYVLSARPIKPPPTPTE